MAEEEQKFYPFKFKKNEDRKNKIEELKKKFNLQRVLQLIEKGELTDDDDEDSVAAKIASLKAVEDLEAFQQNIDDQREKLAEDIQKLTGQEVDAQYIAEAINKAADQEDGFEQKYQKYFDAKEQLEQEADSQKKTEELAKLEDKYKEDIEKHNKLKAIIEAEADIRRAEFFANLPKETQENLIAFAQACEKQKRIDSDENSIGFKEVLDDLRRDAVAHNDNQVEYRSFAPEKDNNGQIKNDHRFTLDAEGRVRHTIRNLGGTGLDINIVNSEFSFLKNQNLSEEQLKVLAEYCAKNGLDIENYANLSNLKVENKDGQETGNVESRLKEELDRHYNRDSSRFTTSGRSTEASAAEAPQPSPDDMNDFCQFIPDQKPIKMDRKKVTDKAKARIGLIPGFSDPSLYRITRHGNSTIISVYANEDDMRIDGEIDKKGKKVHSKQFSVELDFSVPPKPRFYMGNLKEFKADHARLMLDPYKEAGYKYFMLPPATEIGGKTANGAFMEASVKNQMIPYLKRKKDGKGCDVGLPDLATIFKKMPEEESMKGDTKTEYMMRWYRELKAYNSWKGDKNIANYAEQFRVGANFVDYQTNQQEALEDYLKEKFDKSEKSDNEKRIDKVTATIAMTKILQDLQKGQLNGKPFNPLNTDSRNPNNNNALLKQTLDFYMEEAHAQTAERFNNLVNSYSGKVVSDKAEDNAMNAMLREYTDPKEGELSKTLARLKAVGVELQQPSIPKPKLRGERSGGRDDDEDKRNPRPVTMSMGGYSR